MILLSDIKTQKAKSCDWCATNTGEIVWTQMQNPEAEPI